MIPTLNLKYVKLPIIGLLYFAHIWSIYVWIDMLALHVTLLVRVPNHLMQHPNLKLLTLNSHHFLQQFSFNCCISLLKDDSDTYYSQGELDKTTHEKHERLANDQGWETN